MGCDGGSDPVDAFIRGDVGMVDAPVARDVGAAVDAPVVASRISTVPRTDTSHSDWAPVRITAFNVMQNEATNFEEVLVIIENTSRTETFCTVSATFLLKDASGATLTTSNTIFDGSPRTLFGSGANCLPPGEQALGYGNASRLTPLDRVTRIDFSFRGIGGDTTVFATVVDEGVMIVDPFGGGTYSALRGSMRVTSGSLQSPSITFFPLDSNGLPIARLNWIEITTLRTGATWPFTTTTTQLPFTRYVVAHAYRPTSSGIVIDSPEAQHAHDLAEERARLEAEIEARRFAAAR